MYNYVYRYRNRYCTCTVYPSVIPVVYMYRYIYGHGVEQRHAAVSGERGTRDDNAIVCLGRQTQRR